MMKTEALLIRHIILNEPRFKHLTEGFENG
jgi:hypothetical protein